LLFDLDSCSQSNGEESVQKRGTTIWPKISVLVHLKRAHENSNVAGYMSGQSLAPTVLNCFNFREFEKGI